MNEGNYVSFAVANRWIAELIYVAPSTTDDDQLTVPDGWMPDDLLRVHFCRCDPSSGCLELKHYATKEHAVRAASGQYWDVPVAAYEPRIPFRAVRARDFCFAGFSHIVVAQSPRYTPEAADSLLEVIQEYCSAPMP